MARRQRSRQSVFVPAAPDPDSLRGERHFDVADQRLRIHFAIHHEPWFTGGGLDHQFTRASRHRRAERDYQSHVRPAAVLPVKPVSKRINRIKTYMKPENCDRQPRMTRMARMKRNFSTELPEPIRTKSHERNAFIIRVIR